MTMTTPPSGPISLADVRQALADTDPSSTNAGALRKIMGRGSYATVSYTHLTLPTSDLV